MPTVKGFKGIRYNPEKIEDFSKVLAPPYDVISPAEQQELMDMDPLNVVRLVLPKGETDMKYEKAAKTFRDWFVTDVLIQDKEPSIYPLLPGIRARRQEVHPEGIHSEGEARRLFDEEDTPP